MERLRILFQDGIRDPLLFLNLILRVFTLLWLLGKGSAYFGDSEYFISSMKSIWGGAWGGDPFRAPAYGWILALLGGPALTLILQSFSVWMVACHLRKVVGRTAALLWAFDPVLFVYSHAIMSDSFFALAIYFTTLCFVLFLKSESLRSAGILGLAMSATILLRPIGLPFALGTFLLAALLFYVRREKLLIHLKRTVFALAVMGLLIFPRLAWNASLGHGWTIASQGSQFQFAVAGIVENSKKGMSYIDAEAAWFNAHPDPKTRLEAARDTLIRERREWAYLSLKGMLRTLIGHVNVETGHLFAGKQITGPGWFSPEGSQGVSWTGIEKAAWIFGLFFTAVFSAIEMIWALRHLPQNFWMKSWILLGAFGFVILPQVYGDCRFRLPVIALLFAGAIIQSMAQRCAVLPETHS